MKKIVKKTYYAVSKKFDISWIVPPTITIYNKINQIISPTKNIDKKIVVFVHLYYSDLFKEILEYLNNIDYNYTLMIAVFSKKDENYVKKYCIKNNIKPIIKICNNRGRNFGPMLVDFKEIKKYDILLHLHSKKSLRTGREDFNWRNDIYQGLVGSKKIVETHVSNLISDKNIGISYSKSHLIPDWIHHNLDSDNRLFDRLGIKRRPNTKDFLDFPMGGMFWCRVDAIKMILDYDWKYVDFEPEPAADGGTMMHDLEHHIGEIVKISGYNTICFDFDDNTYLINSSKYNLQYYNNRKKEIINNIEKSEVISFDFYDTLFCRLCSTPEDVFWYIGFCIKNEYDTDLDFIKIRKQSELQCRENKNLDVNIDEIYQTMDDCNCAPKHIITFAKELELSIERKILVPRKDVIELAKYAKSLGKTIIISSDTYMKSSFFETVLKDNNILDLFDKIVVSNEINLRKDNRTYWSYVAKNYKYQKFTHIGDNPESDIHSPIREGINAAYIINPLPMASLRSLPVVNKWNYNDYDNYSTGLLLGPIISKTCSNAFVDNVREKYKITTFEEYGYIVLAPTLFAFMAWLTNQIISEKYENIVFFSREGHYLMKMYNWIRNNINSDLPPAHYMYMSRSFAIGASLCKSFEPELITDSGYYTDGTIRTLLNVRCGIEINDWDDNLDKISLPDDRDKITFMINGRRGQIQTESYKMNKIITEYSKSMKIMGNHEKTAIIDIGYSGTIQYALQNAIDTPLHGLYLSTVDKINRVKMKGGTTASLIYNNSNPREEQMGAYSIFLESFLTAPHGHVKTVSYVDDEYVPVCDSVSDNKQMNTNNLIMNGVMEYFQNIINVYGKNILSIKFDQNEMKTLFDYVKQNNILSDEIKQSIYIEQKYNGESVTKYNPCGKL